MKRLLIAFIIFELTACSQSQFDSDTTILDFGSFTVETPKSWKQIKAQGIDSYVGRIAIDDKDTLDFDLGWYSNTLTEYEPQIVERSLIEQMQQPVDTSELIIVENRKFLTQTNTERTMFRGIRLTDVKPKLFIHECLERGQQEFILTVCGPPVPTLTVLICAVRT